MGINSKFVKYAIYWKTAVSDRNGWKFVAWGSSDYLYGLLFMAGRLSLIWRSFGALFFNFNMAVDGKILTVQYLECG